MRITSKLPLGSMLIALAGVVVYGCDTWHSRGIRVINARSNAPEKIVVRKPYDEVKDAISESVEADKGAWRQCEYRPICVNLTQGGIGIDVTAGGDAHEEITVFIGETGGLYPSSRFWTVHEHVLESLKRRFGAANVQTFDH